jgi:ABC-type transport system involved in cytochrome bd biosynthesis fused ATPase/permease subunit
MKSNITLAGNSKQKQNIIANSIINDNNVTDNDNSNIDINNNDNNTQKFKSNMDKSLYKKAVECCSLTEDFTNFPAYDNTEVGEHGLSISGGQKARIALARAVYADADCIIYYYFYY